MARALVFLAVGSGATLLVTSLLGEPDQVRAAGAAAPSGNTVAAEAPEVSERPDVWKLPLGPMAVHDDYAPVNGKGGQEITGPYQIAKNWPPPVESGWQISAEGFYPESPDRLLVVGYGWRKRPFMGYWGPAFLGGYSGRTMMARGDDIQKNQYMIVVFDRNGKVVETWDHYIPILGPNQMQLIHPNVYDPERPLWISTSGPLVQLSRDGKKHIRSIDEKALPADHPQKDFLMIEHFAFASNGDIYASGAAWVTRFTKDGKYVSHFGKPGTGPGEFGMTANRHAGGIHGIQIDSTRNRLYVADRIMSRIQVFDLNGKFLDMWPNIVGPYAIRLTEDGRYLWVGDGAAMKIQKYDALTGQLIPGTTWGTFGNAPGAWLGLHYFTTDSEGNLYTGEDFGWRLQKYTPRKDGSASQLIGPLMD
ncbi:MAG: hypothetical protein A3F70_05145 [Acidobacteria bacterium RIFCSPLOWO2_12_FULL_67_14]|nr:MAG: hypothetical protein A3H29_02435 [Acidobacteria bacterium RIFCSPLOWO2_02_FULL_67_21]OFW37834.1 MAG: hypothetical protein A3F70_05145 [Acidobacteria bacterium RIFCSPLOWO2_12_FULL_67_14]